MWTEGSWVAGRDMGGWLTARASGTSHNVLGLRLLTVAVESRLLATGALGVGSADT